MCHFMRELRIFAFQVTYGDHRSQWKLYFIIITQEKENNKHGNKLNFIIHKSKQSWHQETELSHKARCHHLQHLLNQLGMTMGPNLRGPTWTRPNLLLGKPTLIKVGVEFRFSLIAKVRFGVGDEIFNTQPKPNPEPAPLIINLQKYSCRYITQ